MDSKEQEFLTRLRATFRIEAEEHLLALSGGLLELAQTTDPAAGAGLVESLFREAHSLKGAARSVNLTAVEALCRPLESALAALKRLEAESSPELFELLHQAVDGLGQLVCAPDLEPAPADRSRFKELIRQLEAAAPGDARPTQALPPEAPRPLQNLLPARSPATALPLTGTVRLPIAKLEPLLLQAEELIQAKMAGAQRIMELRELQQMLVSWRTDWVKWQAQPAAGPNPAPGWMSSRFEGLAEKVTALSQAFAEDQRALRRMVDQHLDAMKQVLMLPVSTLLEGFPRLVRELAREQGKEVDMVIHGGALELDKRVLEALKDPLLHLVRNCVDHGLEIPAVRVGRLKPTRGTLGLSFKALDGRQVEILISDDGAGIDCEQLRAAAVKEGILTAKEASALGVAETLPLIFHSGLSTSRVVTDISGRGLGLAIVREKVESLGGQVAVESQPGAGTTLRLRLPLNLATFRGVLVAAGEQLFVLPAANVERVLRIGPKDIRTVENRDTIGLDGQILSLSSLAELLALPPRNPERGAGTGSLPHRSGRTAQGADRIRVCILASGDKRIAVHVDEVLGEEEILVKGLGRQLSRVRNISGAAILGAGRVVPILHVPDLMISAVRRSPSANAQEVMEARSARTGRILVAEDSITARTLLKNILETAGYQVATAVDGVDAFTQLRGGEFDLVVSDVDMPRLSGFELTTRIRGDKKLGELPVVLVTSLESPMDRERGIAIGASAYIIKSSFDQSDLLAVIQQLL
jgi:two-component system chemotaxis sensor kinase CheA